MVGTRDSKIPYFRKAASSNTKKEIEEKASNPDEEWKSFNGFALLQSLLQHQQIRTSQHRHEGRHQINFPKSNQGWFTTTFILRGRALDLVFLPWSISLIHVVVYTVVQEVVFNVDHGGMESWEVFFALVLNTTLSFLLVFRLNRAAGRYWTARELWGIIIAKSRCYTGCLIANGDHDIEVRDHALRWMIAANVATMELIRGINDIPADDLVGVLTAEEVSEMSANRHPAIYALDQCRRYIRQLFHIDNATPLAVACLWTRHIDSLEQQIHTFLECCGGLERIRATPLPMVYVAHLRTFLLLAVLLIPYVWGPAWGWTTIPVVALASFAWLGIDAAAAEAEAPFSADRVNALDMNTYCLVYIDNVTQQLRDHAKRQVQSHVKLNQT